MPPLPVENPSDRGSLVDLTVAYVRANILLRVAIVITVVDHIAAILLVLTGRMAGEFAGLLALLSVLSWFFAVCLPVMNRQVRIRLGAPAVGYWSEVVELFGRIVLFVQTGLYTALLLYSTICGFRPAPTEG